MNLKLKTIVFVFLLFSMSVNGFMNEKEAGRMPISSNLVRMIKQKMNTSDLYRKTLFEKLCLEIRNRNLEVQRLKQAAKEEQIYKKYLAERKSASQFLKDFHTSRY